MNYLSTVLVLYGLLLQWILMCTLSILPLWIKVIVYAYITFTTLVLEIPYNTRDRESLICILTGALLAVTLYIA